MTVRETSFVITGNEADQRLDRFLRKLLRDEALSAIYRMVRTRQVTVNGRKSRPDARLAEGDVVRLASGPSTTQPKPQRSIPSARRDFRVVYEDDALLAVNKPAGLLVHAGDEGDGRNTLIEQVLAFLERRGDRPASPTFRPGLAHRLDRDTSGLVLIGKTFPALKSLTEQIRARTVRKLYLALALGGLPRREGTIDVAIERKEDARARRKVSAGKGRRSVTRYRVLAQRGHYSLVELELITGRTHQIRAHLAHLGAPVAGDDEYGDRARNRQARKALGLKRQFLHAGLLSLAHPTTGEAMELAAPLWPDLREALRRAGFSREYLPDWLPAEERPRNEDRP